MTDPAALPNFPPPSQEHPLRGRVLDALIDLRLQPNLDTDGDVAFQANEQQLFVRCTEENPPIMRTFGQWQLPEDLADDVANLLGTCNEVNLVMNLVKTGIANGVLVVVMDQVVLPEEPVEPLLRLSIDVVLSTVQIWNMRARGIDPNNPEAGPSGADSVPGQNTSSEDDAPSGSSQGQ